jgi:putative pyruvate formate lyase activating enzyme
MESTGRFAHIVEDHFSVLAECRICPRKCGANRLEGKKGVCGSDAAFNISSICIHKGEEPAISGENGICNIFFSRCNLSCIYCQNWQISGSKGAVLQTTLSLEQVIDSIIHFLDQGCKTVGFVSPSHYIPHVKAIVDALRSMGRTPVFVYNTNGYDLASEILELEGYIDVYLPDFKYADDVLAKELSGVADYPEKVMLALQEMFRQKGSTIILDENGQVEKGLIIRHLVLPGNIENSLQVLKLIADRLSESVALSIMSQYWPTVHVKDHPQLGRTLTIAEYDRVVEEMEKLGFYKGWVQELGSSDHYLPDFKNDHPFED